MASFANNRDFIAPGSALFPRKNGASVKTMRILGEIILWKMRKKSDPQWRCVGASTQLGPGWKSGFPG